MRNANDCRAKDPRTCYYHGAIIEMNEAMGNITSAGANAKPADWDGYFNARKKVETAEEDLKKQQWLEESQELRTPKTPTYRRNQARPATVQKDSSGEKSGPVRRHPKERQPQQRAKPIVEAPVTYDNRVFPPQVRFNDQENNPLFFTRHDQTSQVPKGLLLAANRELNDEEKTQLVSFVKYQHTISTRTGKDLKTIADSDIAFFDPTSRSVYVKTQFSDPEQVKGFYSALTGMISDGTAPRRDGTQKHTAFPDKQAKFALYYQ